jgi:outer membrane protein assembly factor BamB
MNNVIEKRWAGGVLTMTNEPTWSFESADNGRQYGRRLILGNAKRSEVVSTHGLTNILVDGRGFSTLLGARGGASGVHEHSCLVLGESCYVAIGPYVASLSLPTLELQWATETDDATCFGVHGCPVEGAFISHGELLIALVTTSGQVLWRAGGADVFSGPVRVTEAHVYAEDFEGRHYCFDLRTGHEVP